jgi:sigma-B regulation protein RsbU (phosphoserine phosphatase)
MRFSMGSGVIAAGGHPLPLLIDGEGVREVGHHGSLLGAFDDVKWREVPISMQPGETLVAITDGVTDAVGKKGERFGNARLIEILAEARNETPLVIRQRLVQALESFQVGAQADDTAVVVMRYTGERSDTQQGRSTAVLGARGAE